MKKVMALLTGFVILSAINCASYKPVSLPILQPEFAPYSKNIEGIILSAKKFDKGDCKRYFDRDILEKGYQPIELSINNDTNRYILFSPQGITLPIVPAGEVAEKVHTNTTARATKYGVAGLIVWPLLIPAVVDGVGSSKSNDKLDRDFDAKSSDQVVIQPYSFHNGVIFVPISEYNDVFNIRLVDRETKEKIEYQVRLL